MTILGVPPVKTLLLPIVLLSTQASAQQTAAQADDSIIVTGQTKDAARERAVAFIRATGVAAGDVPATRWEDPVCPRVMGLAPRQAKQVLDRIRMVATEAGVVLAREPCRSNAVISFVKDGAALVRDLSKQSPSLLAQVAPEKRDALRNGIQPIRWWYRSELVGMGKRGRSAGMPNALLGDHGNVPTHGDTDSLSQYTSSLISTQTMRVLRSATVVVDATKLQGRSLEAVGAFTAMVALAELKDDATHTAGTILGLFGANSGLLDLSEQDRNFLAGLYRLRLDRSARQHRGSLVAEMTKPSSP
ncbi:MAG: hypothetical protein M3R03_06015 [Pseudomonadota bacterium]|nr:hypothetical protein [Pseudomonadota bacterium]